MRISLFGSTGPTGLLLVDQVLAAGHDVVAYARTPTKLPQRPRLAVIEGQLADAEKISAAIAGSDVVVSLLGPGTKADDVPPLLEGYRHIVAAMHEHGLRRLVVIGTPSMRDDADGRDWKVALLVKLISIVQPAAYKALVGIANMVRESGLDWTIVRVPFLSNRPRTAHINARQLGQKGGLRLSRANAAAFMLEQTTSRAYLHRAPFISDT